MSKNQKLLIAAVLLIVFAAAKLLLLVSISFSMKNMDMGFNRYNLAQQSPQSWQALQIRLPFCVEGRHVYTADITVGKQTFQTAFSAK